MPINFNSPPSSLPRLFLRDVRLSCRERAECEDLQNLSLPLSGDTTLELSSAAIDCAILEDDLLEEFIIEGGTLTLIGPSTTK